VLICDVTFSLVAAVLLAGFLHLFITKGPSSSNVFGLIVYGLVVLWFGGNGRKS